MSASIKEISDFSSAIEEVVRIGGELDLSPKQTETVFHFVRERMENTEYRSEMPIRKTYCRLGFEVWQQISREQYGRLIVGLRA
jgi:hypothetical protein